jgi:hypothetical protein
MILGGAEFENSDIVSSSLLGTAVWWATTVPTAVCGPDEFCRSEMLAQDHEEVVAWTPTAASFGRYKAGFAYPTRF